MRHDWERGACSACGWYCRDCNDCKCPGKGWTKYASSSCPMFDTKAGQLRPSKADVDAKRAEEWRDRNRPST
jgi:hypothetical protein